MQVFISYARAAPENVDHLQRLIEASGITVWRDTPDLLHGRDWDIEIRRDGRSLTQVTISDPVTPQDYRVLGAVLLLVIMWLLVLTAPIAVQESRLPAETQQTLNDYYGLLAGLAVSITFLVAPKLMKKNDKK